MYEFLIFQTDDDGNNIAGQCENYCLSGQTITLRNVIIKGARFRKMTAEKSENRFYPEIILYNAPMAILTRPEEQIKTEVVIE
jgi:hypothetical protein